MEIWTLEQSSASRSPASGEETLAGCGSVAKPLLPNSHSASLMKSLKNKDLPR